MAFDATLFQTSRTTNLPGFVPAREHFTLKDCFSSIVAEIVPVHWTIFARGMPGRCRPKQMKATLSGLLRIWLRLISRGDLLENFCDSKGKTLFQSHLTKLWSRFPIINWMPFFVGPVEQLLQVQYFTNLLPSVELTGVQQVSF